VTVNDIRSSTLISGSDTDTNQASPKKKKT